MLVISMYELIILHVLVNNLQNYIILIRVYEHYFYHIEFAPPPQIKIN